MATVTQVRALIADTALPFKSEWVLDAAYNAGDTVTKESKFYKANDTIPISTAFTIGTAGATWQQISQPTANQIFTDSEIQTYIDMLPNGNNFNAAALILNVMAASEALYGKTRIYEIEVDKSKVPDMLRKQAAEFNKLAEEKDGQEGIGFDWAEMALDGTW